MKAAEITHTNTTPKAINLREADRTLSSAVELFINWILSGMSLQAKASKLVRSRAVRARASYPPNVQDQLAPMRSKRRMSVRGLVCIRLFCLLLEKVTQQVNRLVRPRVLTYLFHHHRHVESHVPDTYGLMVIDSQPAELGSNHDEPMLFIESIDIRD